MNRRTTKQSAITVLVAPDGRVLVLRRGPTDPWRPHHWNFPGGKIDPGESVREGARREVFEETGFRLYPPSHRWAFSYRRPGGLTHVFTAKVPIPFPPELTDGEHDAFQWVRFSAIPQPVIPGLRFVVEQLTQHTWNLAPV